MLLNKNLGAIFLIAGTCVGAGMLALPISTAPLGFWLAGIVMIAVSVLMMITGLYTAEVNAWFKGKTSFITMAEKTLGKPGKIISCCLFLFLLYALAAAYIAGGASLTANFFAQFSPALSANHYILLPWVLAFSLLIYLGTSVVDVINKILVIGLVISYLALMMVLWPHAQVTPQNFVRHASFMWAALPILLTSYGYHIIIPSVSQYLHHDVKKVVKTIIFGCIAALVVYLIWVYFIFSVVNDQAQISALQSTETLTTILSRIAGNAWVGVIVSSFIFFAISTSFIGVALGLFHLITDGLKIQHPLWGKIIVAVITFGPPLLFAAFYPDGFLLALGYAGVIVAVIHGVLPTLMVWRGRYHLNLSQANAYRVKGGKSLLLLVAFVSTVVIIAAVASYCGWQPHV